MRRGIILYISSIMISLSLTACAHPCEHEWNEATCTEAKYCSICEEIEGEPLGHDLSEEPVVLVEPTINSSGSQGNQCTRCLEMFDEKEIPPLQIGLDGSVFNFNEEEFILYFNTVISSAGNVQIEDQVTTFEISFPENSIYRDYVLEDEGYYLNTFGEQGPGHVFFQYNDRGLFRIAFSHDAGMVYALRVLVAIYPEYDMKTLISELVNYGKVARGDLYISGVDTKDCIYTYIEKNTNYY